MDDADRVCAERLGVLNCIRSGLNQDEIASGLELDSKIIATHSRWLKRNGYVFLFTDVDPRNRKQMQNRMRRIQARIATIKGQLEEIDRQEKADDRTSPALEISENH